MKQVESKPPSPAQWILNRVDVILRVRHQSDDIAGGVADSGDVGDRTVGIEGVASASAFSIGFDVTECYQPALFQLLEGPPVDTWKLPSP